MLAFHTGFEVECKISEWMFPQHYKRGFHSSGTVGTFGAYVAAAKLLGLKATNCVTGWGSPPVSLRGFVATSAP